jgi:DNA invertase Pin-like site-specific DNA recombinase
LRTRRTDFAKLVELFEAHSVSFVSVTQQFNTTTSMGRLTLNVLLSFAQFEREIAIQPNDDEGIEQVEANGRNDKQVHGSDVRRVVARLTMYLATLDCATSNPSLSNSP